jgi:hypothetical protein
MQNRLAWEGNNVSKARLDLARALSRQEGSQDMASIIEGCLAATPKVPKVKSGV